MSLVKIIYIVKIILPILIVVLYIGSYVVGLALSNKQHNGTPWLPDTTKDSPLTEENLKEER